MIRPALLLATVLAAPAQAANLPQVRLSTELGEVVVEVDPVRAPVTACNFLRYVREGRYDGGRFFRTVRRDRPMGNANPIDVVQGGVREDLEDKDHPPIPLERTDKTGFSHLAGVVSMARNGPDTATSSFFVVLEDSQSLDFGGGRNPDGQGFGAFGRVVQGLEVLREAQKRPSEAERLTPAVAIARAQVIGGDKACAAG